MASKRATAIQQVRKQEEIADRMSAIEANQALIMAALGIKEIPGVEEIVEKEGEVGETLDLIESVDYGAMKPEALVATAKERGIYEGIIGTGKDGNIVKADLVAALTEYDEASAE